MKSFSQKCRHFTSFIINEIDQMVDQHFQYVLTYRPSLKFTTLVHITLSRFIFDVKMTVTIKKIII